MPLPSQSESAVEHRDYVSLAGMPGFMASTLPQAEPVPSAEPSANSGYAAQSRDAVGPRPESARAVYQFFDANEAAFMEAAVDALIPSDVIGPGAKELGVAAYIDRQMAGSYGSGNRLDLEAPFGEGTPGRGNASSVTPSELIRAGITDIDTHAQVAFKRPFGALSTKERIVILADLEDEKIELPTVPLATFFGLLLQLTIEGYFADPMYGGEKGTAAWTMAGFPGASVLHTDKIEPSATGPIPPNPRTSGKSTLSALRL